MRFDENHLMEKPANHNSKEKNVHIEILETLLLFCEKAVMQLEEVRK